MPSNDETRSRLLRWKDDEAGAQWGTRLEDLDPEFVKTMVSRLHALFGPEKSYFTTDVVGWDNVPERNALLIANHSGGTSIPDVWGLAMSWYDRFGETRPAHALAHEMVFALDGVGSRFARMGILRARRDMGEQVLREWKRDLVVMPGGDLDAWRPWTERYKVRFSGRKGYAKLAIRSGAPIVPIAHAGAHDTLIVLTDGQRMAAKLHFPELFRAHIFPVHLSFPFGLSVGPFPHLPPTTRLRYRIGQPVEVPQLAPGQQPTQAMVDEVDLAVRTELQSQLDILRDQHEGVRDKVKYLASRLRGRISVAMGRFPMAAK
jgi:1-acyl-sn-glycerol-3-phosphate acyltransferase